MSTLACSVWHWSESLRYTAVFVWQHALAPQSHKQTKCLNFVFLYNLRPMWISMFSSSIFSSLVRFLQCHNADRTTTEKKKNIIVDRNAGKSSAMLEIRFLRTSMNSRFDRGLEEVNLDWRSNAHRNARTRFFFFSFFSLPSSIELGLSRYCYQLSLSSSSVTRSASR